MVEDLQAIADRINTGTADPDTSRALVVFNLTDLPLSGIAAFQADMSWHADTPLPPVVVTDMDGQAVPSAITDFREDVDRKGRADRRQITFSLRFAVQDVPPQGWRTYIASYTSEAAPDATGAPADETLGLIVVETMRHLGDLPPVAQGVLPGLSPVMDEPRVVSEQPG